jgi:hemimethylated DNA binding protein
MAGDQWIATVRSTRWAVSHAHPLALTVSPLARCVCHWQMQVDNLSRGRSQPFYKVIVDSRDRNGRQLSYVAEENVDVDFEAATVDGVHHPELGRYFKRRVAHPVCKSQVFEPNEVTAAVFPDDWMGVLTSCALAPAPAACDTGGSSAVGSFGIGL